MEEINEVKKYKLMGPDGNEYLSEEKGTLGGHRKLKIYGRLDCPSALRHIDKGHYVQHRVFFKDEETAIAAGYRPCGICMKQAYSIIFSSFVYNGCFRKWRKNLL